MRLLLASASPRRRDLLARAGFELDVRPADVDESERPGEDPAAYVARVARAKAEAVAGDWVIAADTTVTVDGEILAKAGSPEEAAAMMRKLSGRAHQVMTGFVIRGGGQWHEQVVTTDVVMVTMGDELIADYVRNDDWRDKAGAYAIQGVAAALVREVRGSVTNVVGLPLVEVIAALRELGGPQPRFAR